MNNEQLRTEVSEFVDVVDFQFGIYLDSTAGFQEIHTQTIKRQYETIEMLKVDAPQKANMEYMDSVYHIYGVGNPNDPKNIIWHKATQKQFKERTAKGGINEKTACRNCIVLIYEFWETEYRNRIARALEVGRDKILIPIIGDLRLIRHAILHNKSLVTSELEKKSKIINGFSEGQEIYFPDSFMYEIVQSIKSAMDKLVEENTNEDPKHRTIWHVK